MANGEGSSNDNEQMVKSEAFSHVKLDESVQDGSGQALAEVKAHAVANPEDKQARDLLAKLEKPVSAVATQEQGGTGQRHGVDGKLHEASESPSLHQEYAAEVMAVGQVSDAQLNEKNVRMAKAYAEKSPEEAVAKHPELAAVYAARAATETQLSGRSAENQEIVMARFDERAISNIERGKLPALQINERVTQEVTTQREYQLSA